MSRYYHWRSRSLSCSRQTDERFHWLETGLSVQPRRAIAQLKHPGGDP
ncbi:MAG: hypothetical protein SW833_00050 [Cyanobacteriota bacterium]|nr:hypothetical protein [Cyanobacteriota bacterium]